MRALVPPPRLARICLAATLLSASAGLLYPAPAGAESVVVVPCEDYNPCTLDILVDPSCLNLPLPDGSDCDDGLFCTGADSCSGGLCVHTGDPCPVADGDADCREACREATDSCDSREPEGTPCADEGDPCTTDACDIGGSCRHSFDAANGAACATTTTVAPTSTTLPIFFGCSELPVDFCTQAGTSQLIVSDRSDDSRDSLVWKWKKGDEVLVDELGDPRKGTDYALCVYDSLGGIAGLAAEFRVPAGKAWKVNKSGVGYKDKSGAADGVATLGLSIGEAGRTKAYLKASGSGLPLPGPSSGSRYFVQDAAVAVQLVNSLGRCWGSEFSKSHKNAPTRFKAKSP